MHKNHYTLIHIWVINFKQTEMKTQYIATYLGLKYLQLLLNKWCGFFCVHVHVVEYMSE